MAVILLLALFGTLLAVDPNKIDVISRLWRFMARGWTRNREGAGQCEEYGEGRHSLRYKRTASWVQIMQLEN